MMGATQVSSGVLYCLQKEPGTEDSISRHTADEPCILIAFRRALLPAKRTLYLALHITTFSPRLA